MLVFPEQCRSKVCIVNQAIQLVGSVTEMINSKCFGGTIPLRKIAPKKFYPSILCRVTHAAIMSDCFLPHFQILNKSLLDVSQSRFEKRFSVLFGLLLCFVRHTIDSRNGAVG